MTNSKMPFFLLCALLIAVGTHKSQGSPVPDDWSDNIKNAFSKASDAVKSSLETASGKISEISDNIKNSDAYGKVSDELQSVGEKISKAGENLKNTDAYKNAQESINKGVDNIKDQFN